MSGMEVRTPDQNVCARIGIPVGAEERVRNIRNQVEDDRIEHFLNGIGFVFFEFVKV